MKEKVLLKCDHKGCPRKKRIDLDDTMPKNTATIVLTCPWHDYSNEATESYYDKDDKEILDF